MSKEWKFIGSNAPMPMTKDEAYNYHRKQFKWGLKLDKMEHNKPKVNYKKPTPEDMEADERA